MGTGTVLAPRYSTPSVYDGVPALQLSSAPVFQCASFPALPQCSSVTETLEYRNAGISEHRSNAITLEYWNHEASGKRETAKVRLGMFYCSSIPIFLCSIAQVAGGRSFRCSSIPVFQRYPNVPVLQKRLNAGTQEYWNIGVTQDHWNTGTLKKRSSGTPQQRGWGCSIVPVFQLSSVSSLKSHAVARFVVPVFQ